MDDLAIRAVSISKLYTIQKRQKNAMLREQIQDLVKTGIESITDMSSTRKNRSRKNQIWALKDISFEINHGDSIGIIGANGAGKTTLLKVLARITSPTKGKVRIRGRVGSLLEVGTGFHSELTGRENVYLNGAILGMKKTEIDRKFDEIVSFSGVEEFIDTPVKRYSTGMRMRLAFSVAAHLEPEILLVDEVLAVGDIAFQNKSLRKMESVVHNGRTVLFVSHNLAAVKSFCEQSILLDSGMLKYMGDTDTAIQMYLHDNEMAEEKGEVKINQKLEAQILSISPCDSNGMQTSIYPHDKDIFVRIKIYQKSHRYKTNLLFKLYNSDLVTILASHDFEPNGEFLIPSTPGLCEFQLKLPANILAPGKYFLGAVISGMAGTNRTRALHTLDHTASFEVYDNGSLLSQLNMPWKGLIHADIEWTKL